MAAGQHTPSAITEQQKLCCVFRVCSLLHLQVVHSLSIYCLSAIFNLHVAVQLFSYSGNAQTEGMAGCQPAMDNTTVDGSVAYAFMY